MKIHRLAKYFPILEGEEFDLLVQDIKEHGQREPIVMAGDEILDGVNRYRACEQLGIEPLMKQYDNGDPLGYVISMNIRRRHMDVSQRAMLATEMLPEFEKEAEKRMQEGRAEGGHAARSSDHAAKDRDWKRWHPARDDAAKQFGVSGPSVQRAKRVAEQAPERVQDIIKGKTTVSAVDTELRQAKAETYAQEKKEKGLEGEVRERKEYKAYLEATKIFKHELEFAITYAKQKLFAPESRGWIEKRHNEINELMAQLEDLL